MSDALNFKQELTGVFGQPVAENPSQVMMEAGYRAAGLAWRYLTIEVAPSDLGAAVRGARAMGFRGFNCTIPHKIAVIEHLDRLGESASIMGAVNCVVRRDDELVGENTDGKGFTESLRPITDPEGTHVVILGAGGAARAIATELALAGARALTIVNRTESRGEDLAKLIEEKTDATARFIPWHGDYAVPEDADVLVNATSIGLYPDVDARVAVAEESLRESLVVADVIPNPPRTRLLRSAEERGCRTIDGLGMLVGQGVLGFRYWTGQDADPVAMRQALEDVFGA
ncbi:MAG: shikimate dehydrogenase [Planctomycetota bacterium]